MDLEWDEERLQLRSDAVSFASTALGGDIYRDDQEGRWPQEKWLRLADWGYFGLCVPAEYGGAGADPLTGLLITEGLAEGCPDYGLLFSAVVQAWVVIPAVMRFGSAEQRSDYLPGLAAGSLTAAFAATEVEAGSDVFAMGTRAAAVDGGWRLTGRKAFITNAPIADVFLCFAKIGGDALLGGITAFLVPGDAPGLVREPAQQKMGLRTSPVGDVVLDDVFVPKTAVVGKPGRGAAVFAEVLEWERIWSMALHVGMLLTELRETCKYARERKVFGATISSYQAVSHRLAEMKLRVEAGRLLLYRAAATKAAGKPAGEQAALAKLYLSESAVASSLDSLQVHGAYGYMSESGVERRVRDSLASRIYSGTSEMQREIIVRSMGL